MQAENRAWDGIIKLGSKNNITSSALKELLPIINSASAEKLPLDPRALLKPPRVVEVIDVGSGQYCHVGLKTQIVNRIRSGFRYVSLPKIFQPSCSSDLVTLSIGIDGVPISKNSTRQFCPILSIVDQSTCQKPFIIGIYCGMTKPENVQAFLGPFIKEMVDLEMHGLTVDRKHFNIRIRCVLAHQVPNNNLIPLKVRILYAIRCVIQFLTIN